MTQCDIVPITPAKACSGKCKSGGCKNAQAVWIIAACEGMITLFTKDTHGTVSAHSLTGETVFASLDQFQQALDQAERERAFSQLVVVGSSGDIAWVHSSLPPAAARHIAAEIPYPLIAGWFKEPQLPHLTNALKTIFS